MIESVISWFVSERNPSVMMTSCASEATPPRPNMNSNRSQM